MTCVSVETLQVVRSSWILNLLKIEFTGFADGVDAGCERKRLTAHEFHIRKLPWNSLVLLTQECLS